MKAKKGKKRVKIHRNISHWRDLLKNIKASQIWFSKQPKNAYNKGRIDELTRIQIAVQQLLFKQAAQGTEFQNPLFREATITPVKIKYVLPMVGRAFNHFQHSPENLKLALIRGMAKELSPLLDVKISRLHNQYDYYKIDGVHIEACISVLPPKI